MMLAGLQQATIHDGGTLLALIQLAFHWFIQFANGNENFHNGRYKVYQIKPNSVEQLEELNRMEQFGIIDFWRPPPSVNSTADVMIDAQQNGMHFLRFLQKFQIEAKVLVDDLSKLIDEKEIQPTARQKFSKLLEAAQILRDEPESRFDGFGLRMGEYYDYTEMTAFMQRVQNAMPTRALLRTIGWTIEGRPIQGIQFGQPNDRSRPIVWIDAGIHAREWTAVHTAIYFIFFIANQIRLGHDQRLLKCLEKVDILIFPCLNPDGYEYTRSEPRNPSVRMWRKNRSKERCVTDREDRPRCCKGVDLNRNFDFKFAEAGTSFFPCSEIFHGANSFSELETRAVRDAILGSDLRGRVPAMITMHAYSQLWIYPYSHRKHMYPPDVEELKSVARRAVIAIADKFGTNYQYGTGPETIYAYTGGSADWAKETAKIKYTYTIELRPSYWSWNGFILDRAQLIPTARETFDGVMVVLETVTHETAENHASTNVQTNAGSKRSISPSFPREMMMVNSASTTNHHHSLVVGNANSLVDSGAKCEDTVPHCGIWLKNNPRLCIDSQGTMKRECRRTCSFCSFS